VRIIGGQAKWRTLVTPKGRDVRPTTDKIREALFSILGDLSGAVVVDGFAGTGAVGCEALSRGAAMCYFFEPLKAAHDIVVQNVDRVDGADRAEVLACTFDRGMKRIATAGAEPIDLFFLDPPYGTGLARQAVESLAKDPLVTEGALLVVEQAVDDPPVEHQAFTLDDERTYGSTRLRFLRRRGADAQILK